MKKIGKFFVSIFACIITIVVLIVKIPFFVLYPTKIVGKKNLKVKGGSIVACNHYSNFDGIFLAVKLFPNCLNRKFLGKVELSKCWLLKFLLLGIGTIFIDRGKVDRSAMREVENTLKSKKRIVIFPEGTRNKSGTDEMNQIKSGVVFFAKRSEKPIIPIRMQHKARIFRINKIYIGEPYMVEKSTAEEVKILEEKFENLK